MYDEQDKTRKALDILSRNKMQQITYIADEIGYNTMESGWEERAVIFCLEIYECYRSLFENKMQDMEVHRYVSLMKAMANRCKSLDEVQKLQLLAYDLAQDFIFLYNYGT
jgi:hypothetical protein